MHRVKSCGVIVFRGAPLAERTEFLLMCHRHRYDLPKGHMRSGETELQCALRELVEETGIREEDLVLDPGFRWDHIYYPRYGRLGGQRVEKTLTIFLGRLQRALVVRPSEHIGYEWLPWEPPHAIQPQSIDPLLDAVADHLRKTGR